MIPSTPFASGRDADVYALDDRRVLRRYRTGGEVGDEAAMMAHVRAAGFPVPGVYRARGADLVMERLYGPTMAEALVTAEIRIPAAAELLARLHTRLHVIPPRRSVAAEDRVIHLDLHPENIILSQRGPVVIDWRNATDGPPDLDVALTALILAEVSIGLHVPDAAPLAGDLLRRFLARTAGDPLAQLAAAAAYRAADPTLTPAELSRVPEAAEAVRAAAPSTDHDAKGADTN